MHQAGDTRVLAGIGKALLPYGEPLPSFPAAPGKAVGTADFREPVSHCNTKWKCCSRLACLQGQARKHGCGKKVCYPVGQMQCLQLELPKAAPVEASRHWRHRFPAGARSCPGPGGEKVPSAGLPKACTVLLWDSCLSSAGTQQCNEAPVAPRAGSAPGAVPLLCAGSLSLSPCARPGCFRDLHPCFVPRRVVLLLALPIPTPNCIFPCW